MNQKLMDNIDFIKRYMQDGEGSTSAIVEKMATLNREELEVFVKDLRQAYDGFVEFCNNGLYQHQIKITSDLERGRWEALKEMGYGVPEINDNFRSICELYKAMATLPNAPIEKLTYAVIDTGDLKGMYDFAVETNGETAQDIAMAYIDLMDDDDFEIGDVFTYAYLFAKNVEKAPKKAIGLAMLECDRVQEDISSAVLLEKFSQITDGELSEKLMDRYFDIINGNIENY